MDSNHDNSLQRAMCYHYTIGQTAVKVDFLKGRRKAKMDWRAMNSGAMFTGVAKFTRPISDERMFAPDFFRGHNHLLP